jgi:hypothetical protein
LYSKEPLQEIGKLLLDNRHETGGIMTDLVPSIITEDWKSFWKDFLRQNKLTDKDVDDEMKLEIFKEGFLGGELNEEQKVKKPHQILLELWIDYFEDEHRKQVWKYAKNINEKKPSSFKCKTKVPAYFGGMPLQVFNIWQMLEKFTQAEKDDFDSFIELLLKSDELVKRQRPRTMVKLTKEYYDSHNPFVENKWDTEVECIHCGRTFLFNDAVIENELIVCPYEDCDGSLIDFMPTGIMSTQNNRGGVNRNSQCPCGSGKKFKQCCDTKRGGLT